MKMCGVYGCDTKSHAKGLCAMHYQRLRRHGDVRTNYRYRVNRLQINDISVYIKNDVSIYELDGLRDIFYLGKHHGALKINYDDFVGGEWD